MVRPEAVKELRDWLVANIAKVKLFQDFGSGGYMTPYEASGNLPVRNFRDGLFPTVAAIEGKTIKRNDSYRHGRLFRLPGTLQKKW